MHVGVMEHCYTNITLHPRCDITMLYNTAIQHITFWVQGFTWLPAYTRALI